MRILLNGKSSLEEVFAEVDIDTFRDAFREAQDIPEKIPSKLKPLIAMPDFPEKAPQYGRKRGSVTEIQPNFAPIGS